MAGNYLDKCIFNIIQGGPMKKVLSFSLVMLFTIPLFAGDIPPNTGIIAKDCITGDTYDFDALLKANHIIVQQTYSG